MTKKDLAGNLRLQACLRHRCEYIAETNNPRSGCPYCRAEERTAAAAGYMRNVPSRIRYQDQLDFTRDVPPQRSSGTIIAAVLLATFLLLAGAALLMQVSNRNLDRAVTRIEQVQP